MIKCLQFTGLSPSSYTSLKRELYSKVDPEFQNGCLNLHKGLNVFKIIAKVDNSTDVSLNIMRMKQF